MMSTYEIVVALLSTNSSSSSSPPSTIEVTTLRPRKVLLTDVDSEANASSEVEV